MYLNTGVDYYLATLPDIIVVCKSGLRIRSPNIKFKLLSYPDLNKIELMVTSGMNRLDINDEICSKCILGIVGFDNEEIDFSESPCFVSDYIATKIENNSRTIINDVEKAFTSLSGSSSLYERLSLVVAHYTNNSYEFTQKLPIDELVKRYALCSMSFPNVVPPIEFEEEKESRVG